MSGRSLALAALLGALVLHAAPAAAAKKIVAADCDVGGCRCMLSSLTVADVATMTGEQPPPGAAGMTLVMAFGEMSWVAKSPDEVHRTFGGSGKCTLELFPGADQGPRDGVWEFVSPAPDLSKCPLLTSGSIGIPANLGLPSHGELDIRWRGDFDPARYMTVPAEYLRWRRVDAANWRGSMFEDTVKQVSAIIDLRVEARARMVDREHIEGWIEYRSELTEGGPLASLAKQSPGLLERMSCNSRTEYTGRWKSSR